MFINKLFTFLSYLKYNLILAVFLMPTLVLAQSNDIDKIFSQKFEIPNVPEYRSEIMNTKGVFDAFAVQGLKAGLDLSIEINGDLIPIEMDEDYNDGFSELIVLTELSDQLKIIATNDSSQSVNVTIYFFNTLIDESLEEEPLLADKLSYSQLKIVSRRGWGADETLRYKTSGSIDDTNDVETNVSAKVKNCNDLVAKYPKEFTYSKVVKKDTRGNVYSWPLQYSKQISKIIVHHTAETNKKERSPKATMRAIYYYHTKIRGWGDIGYNYVIDREGVVYEGRAGGDFVVGGHAYCYNTGTVGISLMGNFENERVSKSQMSALIQLTDILSQKYKINPLGKKTFHGRDLANILGHRDVGATACPGANLYDELPYLRAQAARSGNYSFDENELEKADFDAKIVSSVKIVNLKPTEQKKLIFKFKNTGKKTWDNSTWLFVFGNPQENGIINGVVEGKNYVAADLKESKVSPGQTGTFEVEVVAGYEAGLFTFEFTPVLNNKYKINNSSIVQPFEVSTPTISYKFVKSKKLSRDVFAGEDFEYWVELKNTGNTSWFSEAGMLYQNAISLGTNRPQDRESLFKGDHLTRLAFLREPEVKPGQMGRFVFNLTAPERLGLYREYFKPVINGIKWLDDQNMSFMVKVVEPIFRFRLPNRKQKQIFMTRGGEREYTLNIRNIGNFAWDKNKLRFEIIKHNSDLKIIDAKTLNELTELKVDQDIAPQSEAELKFIIKTSPSANNLLNFKLVPTYNNRKVFKINIPAWVIVEAKKLKAELSSKLELFYDLKTGENRKILITIKNTGNVPWYKQGEHGVYLRPVSEHSRLYRSKKWISETNVAVPSEEVIQPGEFANFTVWIGNNERGFINEKFKLYARGNGDVDMSPIEIKARIIGKKISTPTSTKPIINQNSQTENNSVKINPITAVNNIRVKLSFTGNKAIIGGDGGFSVTDLDGKVLYQNVSDDVKIDFKNTTLGLNDSQRESVGMRFIPELGTILAVKNWDHSPAWNRNLNDNQYRGVLEVRIDDGQIIIINELPLEKYLQGIAEVSNNDPFEKQKVLAVLARTYAKFYLEPENRKFPNKPYDASDDPDIFQKYLGYGYELRSPNFVKAVQATSGEVVTYKDDLVKTPYFSQSDGRTRSAQEVWGWNNTPYLQSVEDPYCIGLEMKGHGVGLSGFGAEKAAENGKTYREIIDYYYQGVKVE